MHIRQAANINSNTRNGAVADIANASKREACSLPSQAESYLLDVKARIHDM
ncbi:hypothetical protein ACE6H2_019954 [Prunus campanulata]